ncbi:APH(3') family aminoglycoside O-phosphotransferase [Mycobacteroides immunogenum]|uniref:Aminoglycoside phosphotransferase n=1 Tax=Mycobacteroides immunogenum TaxID=83262 RepID=A0A7V8LKE7_9MYCO|nr:APH(3') family aminoglycoside O-phosphotransferase [Mycobacteroides immunogenum]AMT70901.1 aminoglycoside phosphotransferase [Mycobacteroides immunogenum]ANO04008.1 aminoglycoside phosphotransferase APH(3') [Mycobacteroides immunogenum]KIU39488.1 aminoglycoside phosphotransferase [Mycobacteroides immunogenum]KPG03977.1 aminoglycoside phosphotransferase [Mycobacteroides immunogenum]KPG04443.1 aminoglycoside phosphotransferase [Mycobacteroides immunogenum]
MRPSSVRRMFPRHSWVSVSEGESGASVHGLTADGSALPEFYVKVAPIASANPAHDLAAEADRLEWLAGTGVPVARLVDRGSCDSTTWFVTEAVRGIPASRRWPESQRDAVADAMADLALTLHDLPAADCPFDRRLAVTVAEAENAVREDLVDLDGLEDHYSGCSGEQLLAELYRTRPATEDVVVCHGDLCPDNVLLDPVTWQVTGLIDVGRLGRADRHLDLALAVRQLKIEDDPWFGPRYVHRFKERYGSDRFDTEKIAFYTLLDEFF